MPPSDTSGKYVIEGTSPRITPPKLWDSRKPPGGNPKPAQNTRELRPREAMSSSDMSDQYVIRGTSPRIAPPKLWDSSKPPGGKPKPAQKT